MKASELKSTLEERVKIRNPEAISSLASIINNLFTTKETQNEAEQRAWEKWDSDTPAEKQKELYGPNWAELNDKTKRSIYIKDHSQHIERYELDIEDARLNAMQVLVSILTSNEDIMEERDWEVLGIEAVTHTTRTEAQWLLSKHPHLQTEWSTERQEVEQRNISLSRGALMSQMKTALEKLEKLNKRNADQQQAMENIEKARAAYRKLQNLREKAEITETAVNDALKAQQWNPALKDLEEIFTATQAFEKAMERIAKDPLAVETSVLFRVNDKEMAADLQEQLENVQQTFAGEQSLMKAIASKEEPILSRLLKNFKEIENAIKKAKEHLEEARKIVSNNPGALEAAVKKYLAGRIQNKHPEIPNNLALDCAEFLLFSQDGTETLQTYMVRKRSKIWSKQNLTEQESQETENDSKNAAGDKIANTAAQEALRDKISKKIGPISFLLSLRASYQEAPETQVQDMQQAQEELIDGFLSEGAIEVCILIDEEWEAFAEEE